MSPTMKIERRSEVSIGKSMNGKIIDKKSRKITLTRPGEKVVPQNDSTDIATAMAATLCHEINNPLMTITAVAEVLLKSNNNLPSDFIEKLNSIAIAAERIREATHKLISLDSLQYCETAATKMILIDDSDKESEHQNEETILETVE